MEFIEGSRGTYRPIRVLFDTPIYERALQICWHHPSYKLHIALVTELLRLQQKNQLPSTVTAEDMCDLLLEESKSSLRVQLWEFEMEDRDDDVARPLLDLVWVVINSMKMRDVEFEARRLLGTPEAIPPHFQHPRILSQAETYARSLTEQQQEPPCSKLLGPREVVMEVVPKVLQGFWLPPADTSFSMPSQQWSKMAVGVTRAVEDRVSTALSTVLHRVTFSRSTRDDMVLSVMEKIRQGCTRDVLVKRLNCFESEVMNSISDVAAGEICLLFQSSPAATGPDHSSPAATGPDHSSPAATSPGYSSPAASRPRPGSSRRPTTMSWLQQTSNYPRLPKPSYYPTGPGYSSPAATGPGYSRQPMTTSWLQQTSYYPRLPRPSYYPTLSQ